MVHQHLISIAILPKSITNGQNGIIDTNNYVVSPHIYIPDPPKNLYTQQYMDYLAWKSTPSA